MASAQETSSEARIRSCGRASCAVLTHCVCITFTGMMAVLSRPGSSLFSWHPFFMTLAFSLLMTEAILIFSPHGFPLRKLPHKTKCRLHWLLQCLCVCCALSGLAAISYNKHINSKAHFTSWHGLLGLLTVCVVLAQSAAALPLIYHSLAKGWSLAKLKRYHAASGLLVYLLGSASLFLGLCSVWFTGLVSKPVWYLSALGPALCALAVMNQVSGAYVAKRRFQS